MKKQALTAMRLHPQIERTRRMNNRINRATHTAGLLLALICLVFELASPTLCLSHRSFDDPTPEAHLGWTLTGPLHANRFSHTATLLKNGKVLVVGGGGWPCSGGYCFSTVNGTAELYDPHTETWSFAGSPGRRASHSATLLQNGEVLVAGGVDYGYDIGKFSYLNSAQLYNTDTGQWRATGNLNSIQGNNFTTLLTNGKVLAVGLYNRNTGHVGFNADLYDPATGAWSITAAPEIYGPVTLLRSGKVLIVSSNAAQLYDPATESWSRTADRKLSQTSTATLLADGKVLVTGSDVNGVGFGAELYDPDTDEWSVTGRPTKRPGTATLLLDGRVLTAGDYDSLHPANGEDIYDPSTGTWSLTNSLKIARGLHTATLLTDGRVLVTGGINGDGDIGTIYHESAELYGPILSPKIISASVAGKRLYLQGENFRAGAVILLNGEEQKSKNDEQNPLTTLIGNKAGRKIKPGDRVQVRNPDGALSQEFIFTG